MSATQKPKVNQQMKNKTSFSSSAFLAVSLGEIFAHVAVFSSNHWGSHIPSSWMVHAGCVFVAGIHPSRTWMSASSECVQWNACTHRLNLDLYYHLKEFTGNGVRTHVNSKGKIPSTGGSEEGWTHDAASSGQRAQHTTYWAIPRPPPPPPPTYPLNSTTQTQRINKWKWHKPNINQSH